MQELLGCESSFIPILYQFSHVWEKSGPLPFPESAGLATFLAIYWGIKASLNFWPSQSSSKKEWKEDIWYLSIMILPPHFQTLNISILKWLVIRVYCSHFPDNLFCLIQTQPWIYFSCHTVGHDFHWWLVEYEDFKRTNPSTEMPGSLSALEMLLLPWQIQSRAG